MVSGLSISGTLQINADNVTVKNVKVITGGNFGISLTHTAGVTISNSTISGQNSTTGRVSYTINDVYGDSTGMTIKANNISNFRTAVQISTGLADGDYIHDPGFAPGDHTNGFYVGGGTQPLTIQNNTIFDSLGQTDAINLDAPTPGPSAPVANKTIKNNLLARRVLHHLRRRRQRQPYLRHRHHRATGSARTTSQSGQYGPVAYFAPGGTGQHLVRQHLGHHRTGRFLLLTTAPPPCPTPASPARGAERAGDAGVAGPGHARSLVALSNLASLSSFLITFRRSTG